MNQPAKAWGTEQRFFLPNEDARPVALAVAAATSRVRTPVFVGGSGFVLLEVAARASFPLKPTFVDVASFQAQYFADVSRAIEAAHSPADLRLWFKEAIHPRLEAHYRARGQDYPLHATLLALRELFGLSLFFEGERLDAARRASRDTKAVCQEIGAYLAGCPTRHDFIYLSNVPDYLDAGALFALLAACRRHSAPVYALVTAACEAPEGFLATAEAAGFALDPRSYTLDEQNRGLGSRTLDRPWNRPGTIQLLVPLPRAEDAP